MLYGSSVLLEIVLPPGITNKTQAALKLIASLLRLEKIARLYLLAIRRGTVQRELLIMMSNSLSKLVRSFCPKGATAPINI
jgi:hypothetical protein